MIDFSQNTYAALLRTQLARIPVAVDKREGSMIQTALGPECYALEEFYMSLNRVQQQAFIQTANGKALDYLAAVAGVTRYPASAAVRRGVFNAAVPLSARFSTIDGADSINFIVTGNGANQYQLTAETPGEIGNRYVGPVLPITTIVGLSSAQITDILIPGDNEESDDELRARALAALNEKPFGGNVASYREAILAMDGVGAVQIYPIWSGGGTVKCAVLGADFLPASGTLVQTVQNRIDPPTGKGLGYGLAPIGAKATITAPDPVTVNIEAVATLASGYVLGQTQAPANDALEHYLRGIRQGWGNLDGAGLPNYAADVYLSRVIAALLSVPGIVNVTSVTLNGAAKDILLVETGATQQVPVLGTVNLHE